MRVLIVEDEPDLAGALQRLLQESGFVVDVSHDGEEGLWLALEHDYDLAVLDLMLPRLQGERLLAELRATPKKTPVLVLTARDGVADRVRVLNAGADDYLLKPFEPAELIARCRALIRRAAGHASSVLTLGDVELDTAQRTIRRNGLNIAVTPREFALLEYLALHRRRVVPRAELLEHLYGDSGESLSNVLDVFVGNLRRKLSTDLVRTRRGHGYIIEA